MKWLNREGTMSARRGAACEQRHMEDAMSVKSILERKGHDVLTVGPNEKVSVAVKLLADHRIGALVVTNGDQKIVGIISERDIVQFGAVRLQLLAHESSFGDSA